MNENVQLQEIERTVQVPINTDTPDKQIDDLIMGWPMKLDEMIS